MIPANWKKATIGELCQMVKGKSPTMKTKSGAYPLVTMGEEHKTADSYQLDTEAVCVPMISSFGHGKAGLKRVHYIKGKFALSNILMALVVKEPRKLSTKYLALYLQTFKDQLIVPLQTGAANMSLRPDKLAGVPVRYPSHKEQERIVSIMDEMDYLLQLRQQAQQCSDKLIPSIFFKLFGNPLKNDKKWNVKPLRNLGKITTGSTPPSKKQNMFDGEIPFVTPGDLENDTKNTKRFLSAEGAKNSRTVRSGTTLVCCIGATIGKADRTWIESAFNQQINAIEWGEEIADDYGLFGTATIGWR